MTAVEECFVCLEAGGRRRCKCNTQIHDACLARLISSVPSHRGVCAVCKEQYTGVRLTTRKVWKGPDSNWVAVFCMTYMFFILSAVFTTVALVEGLGIIKKICFFFLTVSSSHAVFVHVVYRKMYGKWCCISSDVEHGAVQNV